jgi:TolB-like protein
MKNILLLSLFCFFVISNSKAQILKVAILDFENTSGIPKYDGLGKAMSSMLITDIESNVSPKRLQLVERAQILKILKEQNFQSSSAVDKTTTVKAGKIIGVKYLLVGDIYILNDVLVINARLTDTETGDIKFSKKQEGKLSTWLMLKTNIAKELALSISMPFTEPNIPDKEMNVATITTFGNAVVAKDEGKIEKAEELLNTVQEFSPDFKYLDDLKSQLDVLKKQVEKNTASIQILEKSGGRIINPNNLEELIINYNNPITNYNEKTEIFMKKINEYPSELLKTKYLLEGYQNHGLNSYSKFYDAISSLSEMQKTCSKIKNKELITDITVKCLKRAFSLYNRFEIDKESLFSFNLALDQLMKELVINSNEKSKLKALIYNDINKSNISQSYAKQKNGIFNLVGFDLVGNYLHTNLIIATDSNILPLLNLEKSIEKNINFSNISLNEFVILRAFNNSISSLLHEYQFNDIINEFSMPNPMHCCSPIYFRECWDNPICKKNKIFIDNFYMYEFENDQNLNYSKSDVYITQYLKKLIKKNVVFSSLCPSDCRDSDWSYRTLFYINKKNNNYEIVYHN